MGVRADSDGPLADTDGDYSAFQVDAQGRLKVSATVDVPPSEAEFAEDSEHASGDVGVHVLAVRQDVLSPSNSSDGDYSSLKVTELGELRTNDASAVSILTSVASSTTSLENNIDSLIHIEDSLHISGSSGLLPLAVRNDVDGSLTDTDGDYSPLQVDTLGKLKVHDSSVVQEQQTTNTKLDELKLELESLNLSNSAISDSLDQSILTAGTEDGLTTSTKFVTVNNVRLQILATHDRSQDIQYADFGTPNQRTTRIDYTSPTFSGIIARKNINYTLVGTRYRRDSITWSIINV